MAQTERELRNRLIKLAYEHPELRAAVLPLLKQGDVVQRIAQEVKKYAKGEPVTVELVDSAVGPRGGFWIFSSELGMYRIWDAYTAGGKSQKATVKGWSAPYRSFYVLTRPGAW